MSRDYIFPHGPLKQLIMVVFWFQVEVIYIDCIPIECYGTKAIVITVVYENRGGYKNLNSIVNTSMLCEAWESMSQQETVDLVLALLWLRRKGKFPRPITGRTNSFPDYICHLIKKLLMKCTI